MRIKREATYDRKKSINARQMVVGRFCKPDNQAPLGRIGTPIVDLRKQINSFLHLFSR